MVNQLDEGLESHSRIRSRSTDYGFQSRITKTKSKRQQKAQESMSAERDSTIETKEENLSNDTASTKFPWSDLPRDLLPTCVWNCVNRMADEPFPDDTAYFEFLVACEAVWKRIISLESTAQAAIYNAANPDFGKPNAARFEDGRLLKETLYHLGLYLDKKRMDTIALGPGKPLVERFLDAMGVSDVEKDVFRFVLVAISGGIREIDSQHFSLADNGAVGFVSSKEAYQRFSNMMSLSEFLNMTSRESKWTTEHLLERTDILGDDNMSAISNDTLRILIGFPVPNEKVYAKIECPCLQAVLLEYEPFKSSDVGNRVMNDQQRPNESLMGEEEDGAEDFRSNSLMDKLTAGDVEGNIFDIIGKIQEQDREAAELDDHDAETSQADEEDKDYGAYRSELDYLEDQFRQSKLYVMLVTAKERADDDIVDEDDKRMEFMPSKQNPYRELTVEEWKLKNRRKAEKLAARLQKVQDRIRCRLQATKKDRKRLPRLEQLMDVLGFSEFDRFVILILTKSTINPDTMKTSLFDIARSSNMVNVEHLIGCYSSSLEMNMKCRRSFYKSGPLIKEGIVSLSDQDFTSDLNKCRVYIDRRFVDYICGVDLELSELVDGSHLYTPSINIDDVILPTELKNRIVNSALNFEALKVKYRELKIDEKLTYGLGQIFLFYGSSGTGKTMMANAIASKLNKKVLLVNFPSLGYNEAGETIKMLFREARIKKAILFFDECESMFRSRDLGASAINTCLSELERFDDMCILATNRACKPSIPVTLGPLTGVQTILTKQCFGVLAWLSNSKDRIIFSGKRYGKN
jgi:ATPase family associated with various cellular activities (AAA)